jgi:hypothetical protein
MLTDEQYDSCILEAIDFYGGEAKVRQIRAFVKLHMGQLYDYDKFMERLVAMEDKYIERLP